MYQNSAHVEKGVVETITNEGKMRVSTYHIKFKDKRQIISTSERIRSSDETDIVTILKPSFNIIQKKRLKI